jgi:uncharacterized paraquat-inducible protein A
MAKARKPIRCERCKTVFHNADGVCPTCHWRVPRSRVNAVLVIGIVLGLVLLFLAAYFFGMRL